MKSFRILAVALAIACAAVCLAQTARPVIVELLRPQSDDLGHYVAFVGPISFPIMGVVASYTPATKVIVNGVSAVLFAVYHVNAWLFLPMLVFGLALGWLTWTRRSLWPAIAMHVLYNGLAVAAAFSVPK